MDYQVLADLLFPHVTETPEELEARKAAWVCPEPRVKTGYLARYARDAKSADQGGILE